MQNKYKIFVETMTNSQDENIITNCNSLISSVTNYYSHLERFNNLKKLKNCSKKYSDTSKDKVSIKENYLLLKCYECIKDSIYRQEKLNLTFKDFLDDYIYENYLDEEVKLHILDEYPTLNVDTYRKAIKNLILKYRKLHKSKDFSYTYVQERLDSIKEFIEVYNENNILNIVDEETAFNILLSDEFVNELIIDIQTKSPFISIKIAPIRCILTDRNPKNSAHSYAFNISIDKSLEHLKIDNKKTILKYKKHFKEIKNIDCDFKKFDFDSE